MARPSAFSRERPRGARRSRPGRRRHHNPVSPLGPATIGSPTSCAGFNRPTDIVGVAPSIARLRSNGGPTQTIALRKGSAAINKAKRSTAPNKDQGGRKRTHEGHRRVRAQHRAPRVLTGRQPDRREPLESRRLCSGVAGCCSGRRPAVVTRGSAPSRRATVLAGAGLRAVSRVPQCRSWWSAGGRCLSCSGHWLGEPFPPVSRQRPPRTFTKRRAAADR
jgi:hypothetical protein